MYWRPCRCPNFMSMEGVNKHQVNLMIYIYMIEHLKEEIYPEVSIIICYFKK
jgi:hypothetical protein